MTNGGQSETSLPSGKYTFVGIDIDTTGRRILDEIVHLAAYSPKSEYDQYIIPVMNLNPAARQRHQIRVINVGFFRMLKCILTNKVVKSKTEITALRSFLDWLEERKASDEGSKGVVLIYHEPIKFTPYMLLEAFKRYDLLDRFLKVVVAFVDGNAMSTTKCATSVKYNSLRHLAKLLLNEDEDDEKNFEGNASVRARLAYQIVQHLSKGEQEDASEGPEEITTDSIQGFLHSVNVDINELSDQNKCMDLQHSFRPIFVNYFKTNLYHRYKAVTFRRVLAEKGYDLKSLENIWNEQNKDGLVDIVSKLEDIKEENREELVNILDSFFDPEKEAIVPAVKKSIRGPRRRSFKKDRENRGDGDRDRNFDRQNSTPDSTTRSPRKPRRNRRRFSRRQLNTETNEKTNGIQQAQPINKVYHEEQPIVLTDVAVGGN